MDRASSQRRSELFGGDTHRTRIAFVTWSVNVCGYNRLVLYASMMVRRRFFRCTLAGRRLAAIAAPGLIVLAVLAPSLGAVWDHHFAERTENHAHIYPGGRPVAHTHTPNAPHVEPSIVTEVDSGAVAVLKQGPGVQSAVVLIGPSHIIQTGLDPADPKAVLLVASVRPERRLASRSIAPPEEPPKV